MVRLERIIIVALVAAALLASGSAQALTNGVKFTDHNLSTSGGLAGSQFVSTDETEICIFCHIPHSANTAGGKKFLWNRPEPTASTFALYTASPTLTSAARGAVISEISKMCMSCHDGLTAVNSMANPRSVTMQGFDQLGDPDPPIMANIGEGDATLGTGGGNLTNDHPISFSYADARTQEGAGTTLKDINTPKGQGLVFWGPNSDMVECVTCHDPHVNYNTSYGGDGSLRPFLRRSNSSSNLCFACHDK